MEPTQEEPSIASLLISNSSFFKKKNKGLLYLSAPAVSLHPFPPQHYHMLMSFDKTPNPQKCRLCAQLCQKTTEFFFFCTSLHCGCVLCYWKGGGRCQVTGGTGTVLQNHPAPMPGFILEIMPIKSGGGECQAETVSRAKKEQHPHISRE